VTWPVSWPKGIGGSPSVLLASSYSKLKRCTPLRRKQASQRAGIRSGIERAQDGRDSLPQAFDEISTASLIR
jgi:hypothetical protein